MFYQQLEQIGELGRIDKELLYRGFEDGLYGNDTVISKADKMTVIEEFNQQVSARMQQEQDQHLQELSAVEAPKWEEIKAIPGIREMEGGVMVQTLKKGSGASPTATDDVDASYILSNFKGEMMQNSADVTPDGRYKTNIGTGVIRGWTIGFQAMQKGGRYKLYVPAELAYRQESLVFEIELFDFGPAGTLAPPPQQQGY
jgi:FKBP-type peptidyl-prolyl cis-trans isomerase